MQIAITASPIFHLPLQLAELELLSKLSSTHYDGVCQGLSRPGASSFLYGWLSRAKFAAVAPDEDISELSFQATTRELDLLLKVLENTYNLPLAESAMAYRLSRNFRGALRYAVDDVSPAWKAVFAGCSQ